MKKIIIAFVIIVVLFICAVLFRTLVLPTISIVFEDLFVKNEIDNPFVNDDFSDWTKTSIPGINDFYIPNEWKMTEDNNVYSIVNESGQIWAYGTFIGNEELFFSRKDFIAHISSKEIEKIVWEYIPQYANMDGSYVHLLTAIEGNSKTTYSCIQLSVSMGVDFAWILNGNVEEDEYLYDIAEALVYSFEYKK